MLLECSLYNSSDKSNNAQWTNTFQKPVLINTNDTVSIRSAFLNTNKAGAYGDITINEDITLSMRYGYFENYYETQNKTSNTTQPTTPDMGLYVMRDSNNHLVESESTIALPAGTYAPSLLAEIITQRLTKIKDPTTLNEFTQRAHTFLYETGNGSDQGKIFYNDVNDTAHPHQITVEDGYPVPTANTAITLHYNEMFVREPFALTANVNITSVNSRTVTIDQNLFVGDVKYQGIYSVNTNAPATSKVNFCKMSNASINYQHMDSQWSGASQVGLMFDNNNNGRFNLVNYTPYYGALGSGTSDARVALVDINIVNNPNTEFGLVDCQGGIFFTQLEPQSFWQDTLGFNLTNVLVSDTSNTVALERGKNISSGLFSIDALLDKKNHMNFPTGAVETITDQINIITADNNYRAISDGGYFLLRVSGLPVSYEDDRTVRNDIMAVCSRQYDNNGYITFFGGDGTQVFVNRGAPFLLSSVDVAVLDPDTKQPSSALGTGNSIFLEVSQTPLATIKK